ncbi:MAG: nucleoside triphosphate pyrophosphohydrolase [Candidatus Competibacteraceae bacterium]|jgi:MazG family protein|nr:nucleoside triphosphate pyrophosphohydrolase [Candidatus Competibacteraceae bacterium]
MTEIERLLEVMAQLRNPDGGCPWDQAQTYATILPYTLEEAYEVADAIEGGNREELKKELGDLLFQVVFYAQIASEEQAFTFKDVVQAITEKMIARHPHVFSDAQYANQAEQQAAWEQIKATERDSILAGLLDDIPRTLPAVMRAMKLQRKAARVGFDWPAVAPVLDKVQEELTEIQCALNANEPSERVAEEVGDLLFACVNLARHLRVEPESALRTANHRFESRFRYIEAQLTALDRNPEQASLAELDALWEQAKTIERG